MYDELAKRLRARAKRENDYYEHGGDIINEAADAIEELSKYADTIRRLKCEGWYLQQTKFHDGYHAVSTMPLPEPPKCDGAHKVTCPPQSWMYVEELK